jgi:hypothetical protein
MTAGTQPTGFTRAVSALSIGGDEQAETVNVLFRWTGKGSSVSVVGTWNGWVSIPHGAVLGLAREIRASL